MIFASTPSGNSIRNRRAARIGPTVCDDDGPIPILKRSVSEMYIDYGCFLAIACLCVSPMVVRALRVAYGLHSHFSEHDGRERISAAYANVTRANLRFPACTT